MKKNRNRTAIIKTVNWSMLKGIPNGKTLQQCLSEVCENNAEEKVITHNHEKLQLMQCCQTAGMLMGVLAVYEEGKAVEGVKTDKKTKKKVLFAQKLTEGEKLESALYFVIQGDKAAIVQSNKLHASALAKHLENLLTTCFDGVEGTLILEDSLPEEVRQLIINEGVNEIKFSEWLSESEAGTIKIASGIFGHKVADSWDKNLAKGLKENSYSGIKTSVSITLSKKERPIQSIRLLRALALGMANDLKGVSILLGNNKRLQNDMLITKTKIRVWHEDGIPVLTEMFKGLQLALKPPVETV